MCDKSEVISRRRALSLFGMAGALSIRAPSLVLMPSNAEAQTGQTPPAQSPLSPSPRRPPSAQTGAPPTGAPMTGTERLRRGAHAA